MGDVCKVLAFSICKVVRVACQTRRWFVCVSLGA